MSSKRPGSPTGPSAAKKSNRDRYDIQKDSVVEETQNSDADSDGDEAGEAPAEEALPSFEEGLSAVRPSFCRAVVPNSMEEENSDDDHFMSMRGCSNRRRRRRASNDSFLQERNSPSDPAAPPADAAPPKPEYKPPPLEGFPPHGNQRSVPSVMFSTTFPAAARPRLTAELDADATQTPFLALPRGVYNRQAPYPETEPGAVITNRRHVKTPSLLASQLHRRRR